MTSPRPLPARFYSLDALRGLAALAVVHTHWFVFFAGGKGDEEMNSLRYPFRPVLGPLYEHGWRAVDLFFCLSGFVFWWLYAERIATHRIGARTFSRLRFSRLYPLHVATLLFVAGGQWVFQTFHGSHFSDTIVDGWHFLLNLFFVSGLGFERGGSFNGPAWTVSVEVFLYAVFFAVCARGWRRWWQIGALASLGFALEFTRWTAIGRGLLGFFVGVLAFQIFAALHRRRAGYSPVVLVAAVAASWLIVAIHLHANLVVLAASLVLGDKPAIAGYDLAWVLSHHAFNWLPFQILPFPCTVIALALLETQRGTLGRRLAFLGDISYSSYLLHFPTQLVFVFIAMSLGMKRTVFNSPLTYLVFFSVLIVASLLSHHYFERPAQRWLRGRTHS